MTENSYVTVEVKDKCMEIKPLEEDFVSRWNELRKNEGLDVTKKMIYDDKMYKKVSR